LFLLFIEETSLDQILSKEAPRPKGSGGPNQGAEMSQIRVPKSSGVLCHTVLGPALHILWP
jgi:hypothetical protein